MKYKVCISNPENHFVKISALIHNPSQLDLNLQLPAWRPGRYELANYAKNIRCFKITNDKNEPIAFQKVKKDLWQVKAEGLDKIYIEYEYYANQPDAGASFVSDQFLYLNPVNCFMYVEGRMTDAFELELEIPEDWQIACQLPMKEKTLYAKHFDQLADSPFFASPNLTHHTTKLGSTNIHLWFQGGTCPDPKRLLSDTLKYAEKQVQIFGEFPMEDYHFLYLLLPDTFRHGVEHADSTVIAMGPANGLEQEEFYHDFLGISSHELFHLWNIKRIRPESMLPYDFTKENYSHLGYVYEGITTYYGDLMLYNSGVWDFDRYSASLASDLTRHYNNEGRFNYSVAESSFDTWLDGYTLGVKGRKVSIYMEGLVAALVADVKIISATNGGANLDTVMRKLYEKTHKMGIGYSEELYRQILEEVSGISFEKYFSELIWGKGNWDKNVENTLNLIGLELVKHLDETGKVLCHIVKLPEQSQSQLHFFEFWTKRC